MLSECEAPENPEQSPVISPAQAAAISKVYLQPNKAFRGCPSGTFSHNQCNQKQSEAKPVQMKLPLNQSVIKSVPDSKVPCVQAVDKAVGTISDSAMDVLPETFAEKQEHLPPEPHHFYEDSTRPEHATNQELQSENNGLLLEIQKILHEGPSVQEYEELIRANGNLVKENTKLREKIERCGEKQSKDFRRLKAENFGLLNGAEKLQEENRRLKKQIEKMEGRIAELQKNDQQLQQLEGENRILREDKAKLRLEAKALLKSDCRHRRATKARVKDVERLREEIRRLTGENEKFKRKAEESNIKNMRLRIQVQKLSSGNHALFGEKLKSDFLEQQEEVRRLSDENKELQDDINHLNEKMDSYRMQNRKLREDNRLLALQNQEYMELQAVEAEVKAESSSDEKQKEEILAGNELRLASQELRNARERIKSLTREVDAQKFGGRFDSEGRKIIAHNIPPGPKPHLEAKLRKTFERYGEIVEAFVIRATKNPEDCECANFGFVTFTDSICAEKAIQASKQGRLKPLRVERARPRGFEGRGSNRRSRSLLK